MSCALEQKLSRYTPLSSDDRQELRRALGRERTVIARASISADTSDPFAAYAIMEGRACRSRQLGDNRKQIVSLLLPGDLCDPHAFLLQHVDHAISALTPVTVARISGAMLREVTTLNPSLGLAIHREGLATAAIQREWTVSLGCRSGIERLAHLFCELYHRLKAVGLATKTTCPFPLTQHDLARMLGQTSVHINRTLQELRRLRLVSLRARQLTIHDLTGLAEVAHFDPAYLHFTAG
jgi:CRP-like cAMP-binding protein